MNESETRDVDPRDSGYRSEQNMESGGQQMSGNGTGGLSIGDYQRLRKGYERAINPDALQKMNPGGALDEPFDQEEELEEEIPQGRDFVQTSRRVVRIRPETHPSVGQERSWQGDYREEPRRRRGGIGPFAVISILLIGLAGGLVLYAGGAEYIAGLFGGGEEEYGEDLTLVTERPGATYDVPDDTPTPGEMVAGEEGMADDESVEQAGEPVIPEEDVAKAEAEERAAAEKAVAEKKRLEAEKAAEAKRAEAAAAARSRETPSVESTGEREVQSLGSAASPRSNETTSSSSPGRYTAQVGATPDRSEADRIASRLRSRGGSGVTVVTAEKNGAPIYRVRFGSFSSEEEARQQSSRLGFSDVWIIER